MELPYKIEGVVRPNGTKINEIIIVYPVKQISETKLSLMDAKACAHLPKLELQLPNAFRMLLPVADNWQNIGILLHIPDEKLTSIVSERLPYAVDNLREMLRVWLKQTDPKPSWEAIVEAVKPFDAKKADEINTVLCW